MVFLSQPHPQVAASCQAFYDAETRKVVESLKQANPERIIRFGSSVRGELDQDSDIDLCVLIQYEDNASREKQRLRRLLSRHSMRICPRSMRSD